MAGCGEATIKEDRAVVYSSARAGATFHVIPDSVADPRLILQAAAHPEHFILDAGILAGLSSLTLLIIEGVKLWDIGD
ncbi:MAG: hypothetical protein ACTHY7_04295 [Marinobacter sp.]